MKAYPYEIDKNCVPQCDIFMENGYTKEEMKLTNETKKILDKDINVTATAVRVPVVGGHSEAVNIEFESEFDVGRLKNSWMKCQELRLLMTRFNVNTPCPSMLPTKMRFLSEESDVMNLRKNH